MKFVGKFKKFIAVLTSISFLFTTIVSNNLYANVTFDNSMDFVEKTEFLSPSLGKVTSSKYYNSDEIVINIQDLHCHAQTQRQISSIIGVLESKYQIEYVFLEGAYKEVSTSWLSGFNDGQKGSQIIEKMVDDGRLSGTEYYSLINNKRNFIKPIENEQLYKENIKLLNEIISKKQEIEFVCNELEEQIKKIRRSYSSDKARKLDKLTKDFKEKRIDSKKYYLELIKYAKEKNINIDNYPNIVLYMKLIENNALMNETKIGGELSSFLVEVKSKLPYQTYIDLVKRSNNFSKIENITNQIIDLNNKYQITKNLKLKNLEKFINYLDFNKQINPIEFIEEENSLKEETFFRLGRTKYEREVAFLNDFIPNIREYFTANISAQEYNKFKQEYQSFRTIWPSYFAVNTVKKLDKYNDLLNKYHENNLKRDYEFAKRIITKNNENGKLIVDETSLALEEIEKNIKNKKVKVVVTGGFHTKGLEKILENKKISYAIITPKITESIEKAKEIYWNTIIYNATILKNTINLEPLFQEKIDIVFPQIMESIFKLVEKELKGKYTAEDIKKVVNEFVDEKIIQRQDDFKNEVEIESWEIENDITSDTIIYRVIYKDNSNKGTIIEKEYVYSNGKTIPFSKINAEKASKMLEKISNRKYASPAIELEPSSSARKKIKKYILDPLKSVTGNFVEYMDYKQLHMTVGYDSSIATDGEVETLINISDSDDDIFVKTRMLGESVLQQTTLRGTLKLMPDGVIIYEITDFALTEQMFNLRDKLMQNSNYKVPSIVHMTIGRIADKSLLDNTEESKEKLAELLRLLNEKIYEINEANELANIESTFNIKGGYVSATGNTDYKIKRIGSNISSLSILRKILNSSNKNLNLFWITVVVPIFEEIVFRILPSLALIFTSYSITTAPILIIPVIVTAVFGTVIFSYAHTFADKLTKQKNIRNWKKDILPRSIILTGIYLGLLIAFPGQVLMAPIFTILLHSLFNLIVVILNKFNMLSIIDKKDDFDSTEKEPYNFQLSFGIVDEYDEVFYIQNPLNEEESIPVYLQKAKASQGYICKLVVDTKYEPMTESLILILTNRLKGDTVIQKMLEKYVSVFERNKLMSGDIEILPPSLSDDINVDEIDQSVNSEVDNARALLASA